MKHVWSEDDDIIGYYLYRFADTELRIRKQALADKLGVGWSSMTLKIANFDALASKGKMGNASLQSKNTYDRFKDMPDEQFKIVGQDAITRALNRRGESADGIIWKPSS